MTGPLVLAIDQGTTNTKAVLVDAAGRILARASAPLTSSYPQPGWAEQSAEAIWGSVRSVIDRIAAQAGTGIAAIAIANQRETLVVWDAETGQPVTPAILWQCRRTAEECERLRGAGAEPQVVAATGLGINPLFPAAKLGWVMRHVPAAAELHAKGRLRAGAVDSWLLWNLTGGAAFATDHSNASRTQLFHTGRLEWDGDLGDLFGAPVEVLPRPMPSDSAFGVTMAGATDLPAGIPIRAMMGDSHAALYGHGVRGPGTVKATYGTGSSLMTLAPARVASTHGLSGTIAWSDARGPAHALEGNITVSAQAAAFMAGLLGLSGPAALSDLAQTVGDSGGVSFVPALAGLGAPHWDDHATGTVTGMSHASRPAHLARASFDAIALQIADVFEAMEQDTGHRLEALRADGGASSNDFLMQLQADVLGRPVIRAEVEEVGALGAAAMAFRSLGVEPHFAAESQRFEPGRDEAWRAALRRQWRAALAAARGLPRP